MEVGTAYLSIVPETSRIAPGIRSALGQADREAARAGRSMGGAMSSALGSALKGGAVAAAAAGTAAIGTAMVQGFKRLDAIDQAKGKLSALGASPQTTAKVMDSALAAVKGTAYGLGDAATISASAMAAGVKPGKDLTKYLSMTADTAAIAGTSLGDMGAILNQVQTGQMAYTDDLNQLADRGIPIYQWLAKEAGVTGGEVKKMAGDGKISSEMFFKAIEANVGGAAKTIGSSTVKGGFENLKAAMGRLGAAALEPGFNRLPTVLTNLTGRIDALAPKAKELSKAFDEKVFGEWAPKIREAFEAFQKTGAIDDLKTTLTGLWNAMKEGVQASSGIRSSLAAASAAIGVSGWQLFLTALQAGTTVLDVLNPLLRTTADLMQNNQGVVTGLVAAWLAFKTVPALLGRVTGAVAPMTSSLRSAGMTMAVLNNHVARAGSFGSVQMGRFGSSIAYLGERAPAIARMQSSFLGAAAGAQRFGRTAGVAAAAGSGLRSAGSAVAGVFGGPLGLALTGAAIAGTMVASEMSEAKSNTEAFAAASKDLTGAQESLKNALTASKGAVDDSVIKSQSDVVDKYTSKLAAAENQHQSMWETVKSLNFDTSGQAQKNIQATQATETRRALDQLGFSNEDLAKKITGSAGAYTTLRSQLLGMGSDGRTAAADVNKLRAEFLQQQETARVVSPGVTELGNAIATMGDKGASSSDKLNALKTAMDALNPARNKTEAMAQYGDAIRKVADASQGIGADAFKGGNLDALSESGATLSRTLSDLAEKSAQVASTGGDMKTVAAQNEQVFQQLATATGQPIEKIRELYGEMGGKTVDLSVSLSGAPEVMQRLGAISEAWSKTPEKKTISVEESAVTDATRAALQQMSIDVSKPMNGRVEITAQTDQAKAQLLLITQNVNVLNALKANPQIDLKKAQFDAKSNEAKAALGEIDRRQVNPQANLVLDKLLQGKAVSMQELTSLSQASANPSVNLAIQQLLQNAGIAGAAIDNVARDRTVTLNVVPQYQADVDSQLGVAAPGRAYPNANGSIRQYANGGIAAPESYANGKTPDQALIQKAMPGPGLVQWAEPETGGEAYIPLGKNKRARSQSILATVADMFGLVVMPKDSVPEGVSGWAGALAGIATRGIASGFDGVRKFADGGIVTGQQLRDLANGKGASRPLTGAPYVWGGVNWGDCSGAMSAFARLAAGLSPFGGRFSTAAEADQLAKLGAKSGTGPAGSMRFGWVNGGPGGGHTAGTLPDGTNVEMGGAYGGGMVGGSVGADDTQFTNRAWLPVKDEAKYAGSDKDSSSSDESVSAGSSIDSSVDSGYTFDPLTQDAEAAGDTSISGRAGNVIGAFVKGQISSLFDVLSMNDQPGWLSALTEYEKQHSENAKKNYDAEKKKLDQDYKDAADARKSDLEDAKTSIEDDYQAKRISADERDTRLLSLRDTYEQDELNKRHDYENSVITLGKKYGQIKGDTERSLSLKQRYESNDLKAGQQFEADKFAREAQLNRDQRSLDSLRDSHAISASEYERRSRELKTKYNADVSGMKSRYEGNKSQMKSEFDKSQRQFAPSDQYQPSTYKRGSFKPTDPGVNRPKAGEDTGVDTKKSSSSGSVQDAVKAAFADRGWNEGAEWSATDYIVDHESGWNPTARNPSSGAFGLFQFLGATKDKYLPDENADPGVQGQAGKRYIGDRYGDPVAARAFWEANNWYDQGGQAIGTGLMAKNVITPERVLSPRQTAAFEQMVQRDFQGGSNGQVAAKLDQIIVLLSRQPRGSVNYNLPADRGVERAQKIAESRQRAGLAAF